MIDEKSDLVEEDKFGRAREVRKFGTWYKVNRFEATNIAYKLGWADAMKEAARMLWKVRIDRLDTEMYEDIESYIVRKSDQMNTNAEQTLSKVLKKISDKPEKT